MPVRAVHRAAFAHCVDDENLTGREFFFRPQFFFSRRSIDDCGPQDSDTMHPVARAVGQRAPALARRACILLPAWRPAAASALGGSRPLSADGSRRRGFDLEVDMFKETLAVTDKLLAGSQARLTLPSSPNSVVNDATGFEEARVKAQGAQRDVKSALTSLEALIKGKEKLMEEFDRDIDQARAQLANAVGSLNQSTVELSTQMNAAFGGACFAALLAALTHWAPGGLKQSPAKAVVSSPSLVRGIFITICDPPRAPWDVQ